MVSGRLPVVVRLGVLAFSLAACAPVLEKSPAGPGVPRISNLEVVPGRVSAGCPVTVRFHFEDIEGDVSRAIAHWTLQRRNGTVYSGTGTVAVEPAAFAGKTKGEVQSRLTPSRYGRYWYHFQVEDAAGHRSNALEALVLVHWPWPWAKSPPEC
jgi:hypothetical protein